MPKRIPITLLVMVVIATVALCVATQAVAQDECTPPTTCEADGWTITLVDGTCKTTTCQDPPDSGKFVTCYKCEYEVDGPKGTKGLNHISFLIPDCCPDTIRILDSDPLIKEYPVGQGEPSRNFGEGNFQAYVAKFTQQQQDQKWWFSTNNPNIGEISVCLKVKNELQCCAIAGPNCTGLTPYAPTVMEDITTIKSVKIKILRDAATGCGLGVEKSLDGGTTWEVVPPGDEPVLNGVPIVECGGPTSELGCRQECTITAAASPGWTWIKLGNTWYKVWIP